MIYCKVLPKDGSSIDLYFKKKMDKRPIGYQPGKPSVLDVKIPKTNKYDHV